MEPSNCSTIRVDRRFPLHKILSSLLLSLFLVISFSGIISAGSPNTPLVFKTIWYGQQNLVVEQQSDQHWPADPLRYNPDWLHYVINPVDNCKWNDDDNADVIATNMIAKANTTVSGRYCKIIDSHSAYVCINDICSSWSFAKAEAIGFQFISKSPSLLVSMVIQPQNKVINLTPVFNTTTKNYQYRICISAYYNNGDPMMGYIPGSNGSNDPNSVEGTGLVSYFTPTVTNPTNKDVRDVSYYVQALGASQLGSGPCYDGAPLQSHQFGEIIYKEYPFSWYY